MKGGRLKKSQIYLFCMQIRNKKGAGTALMVVMIIAILVIGGIASYAILQNVTSGGRDTAEGCPESTATPSFIAKEFFSKSTSVTITPYLAIDDGAVANQTGNSLPVGSEMTGYYSASNYIDQKIEPFKVTCGMTQTPTEYLKATDAPSTFLVKDDSGTTLTDTATGGANNASATAGTLELELRIGAKSDYTTGDLIVVIEYDNDTQADEISLGSFDALSSYPEVYAEEASNSLIRAFKVPEVKDGDTKSYPIKVEPESGITLNNTALRVTYFSSQAFEDVDGSVQVGVEDSDGTAKYEDTGDYDIFVVTNS